MNSRIGLLFGMLIVISLVSTRFAPPAPLVLSSAVTPLWSVFGSAALNIRKFIDNVATQRDLRNENTALKARVGELETQTYRLEQEIRRLEEVAQIKRSQSAVSVVAQVTAFKFDALEAELRINRGSQDGVLEKMAVTTPQGLVGEVIRVEAHTAQVRTVIDPDFRIGIKIGKYNGVALARGISGRYLRAQNYKNPKVRVGDPVWSANVPGGAFPTSKIGTVSQIIAGSGESLGQTLEVTPSVDITSLEQVYLLRLP